jgi:hypothetical protein
VGLADAARKYGDLLENRVTFRALLLYDFRLSTGGVSGWAHFFAILYRHLSRQDFLDDRSGAIHG